MALPDDLNAHEQRLVAAAAAGEDCVLAGERPEAEDEAAPTVRADVIRAIVTGDGAPCHTRGLYLRGARVTGALDLESMRLAAPLVLQACHFEEPIVLSDARTRRLELSDSFFPGLSGPGLRVDGELSFTASSVNGLIDLKASRMNRLIFDRLGADGKVILEDAEVSGLVSGKGAKLRNPKGEALSADGLKVGGDVFLRTGFEADGEVRLLGAEIGGQLSLNGAKLRNPNHDALSADGIKVNGGVFLQDEFEADGEVRLLWAEIGGQLSCAGAKLRNPRGDALCAEGMKVKGHVILRDESPVDGEVIRFEADGNVSLGAAEVLGNLGIRGLLFGQGFALDLRGANVRGELQLTPRAKPSGIVDLRHAHAGVLRDDPGTWPDAGRLMLDGFRYDRIHDGARATPKERERWLSLMPPTPAGTPHTQPYEHLAALYDLMGRPDDAKTIRAAKERAVRSKRSWWRKPWGWLLDLTVLYGLRPERAIYIGLAFMVAGGVIFGFAEGFDLMTPTLEANSPTPLTSYTAAIYSADAFLPIVVWGSSLSGNRTRRAGGAGPSRATCGRTSFLAGA